MEPVNPPAAVAVEPQPFTTVFARFLEKVVATYIQALIACVLVGLSAGSVLDTDFGTKAAVAAIPAALTAFAALIPIEAVTWNIYEATFYRAGRTYVATFVGLLIASSQVTGFGLNGDMWKAAAIGALPAALTILKSFIASKVGNTDTAALLPASLDVQPSV